MSLQALPAGLTPEQVEKLRWEAFGHKRALSLKSVDDLVRFTHRRGFVLLMPQPGVHYPSVLEATVGRPLLDFTWDERAAQLEKWKVEAIAARRLIQSGVLGGRPTLLSPQFLVDFYALSGNRGDLRDHERLQEAAQLSGETAALCAALLEKGAQSEPRLRERFQLAGDAKQSRWARVLDEARRRLLVAEAEYERGDERAPVPVFDLLPRLFPEEVEKSRDVQADTARSRIACRYLRNVLVEACHEMARVLEWDPEETLAAQRTLVSKHMAAVHPASRPRRDLFQATSTDVLQEEPARWRKSAGKDGGATGDASDEATGGATGGASGEAASGAVDGASEEPPA